MKNFDPVSVRNDFPILHQTVYRERPLVYLDNGASTQHPQAVIDAMSQCYLHTYANVHRGIHYLSEQASAQYEQARLKVQRFINAAYSNEVIFTSGTTAAINTIARAWGDANIKRGDEILLPIFEHHSNIVPWQQLAERTGASVKFANVSSDGELDWEAFSQLLGPQTKLVAVAAVSNVLGTQTSIRRVVEMARAVNALTLVDAAQHTPHEPTDVQSWNADFVCFSGHKMLGPSGIGILWGRQSLLDAMPPFLGGGSMISTVTTDGFSPGELPAKFEAGTPPIVEAIGLGAAVDYLNQFDLNAIARHEYELVSLAMRLLAEIEGVRVLGPSAERRAGLVSFTIEGIASQDLAVLLDQAGIAIRAGHHCAMPLHQHYKIRNSCRASFYLYNTRAEVEMFGGTLKSIVPKLR